MAPVTEVAKLPLKAGVDIANTNSESGKIWQDTIHTILDQEGAQTCYFGRAEEDQTALWLFVDWDSVAAHEKFIGTPNYAPFVKNLMTLIDGDIRLFHVPFKPSPPTAALSDTTAPVTELITQYYPGSLASADQDKVISDISRFPFPRGSITVGFSVEEVSSTKVEGGKAKILIGLYPWQSVKEHLDYRETQTFKDNVGLIRGSPHLKGVEVVHVKFTEVQRGA